MGHARRPGAFSVAVAGSVSSQRSLRLPFPLDLRLTCGHLRRGKGDPTTRTAPDHALRATRTPAGAATVLLTTGDGVVEAEAWGPGRSWVLDHLDDLVGLHDEPQRLQARHPIVGTLHKQLPGLRIAKTHRVLEALVPAILEQKVTSTEAWSAFRRLVWKFGEPAPGPHGLRLPPDPEILAAQPYYAFHTLGIERRRAEVIRFACRCAPSLERVGRAGIDATVRALTSIPGIGPWTAAEVTGRALGDADAVPVGDYHIPHIVTSALAGESRGDDARMLELLEPYRGQRGRVIRLLEAGVSRSARRAPRARIRSIAGI